ncbi:hypothetical protein K8R03_04435 [Candidatus Kaiserbacteria bacterium]|nr:hypothetical protein [Candidatus Kaiserbacteria bacterium]
MSHQKRIGPANAFLLIAFGVILDGVQFFSEFLFIGFILDPIISIMATIIYVVWLSHYNVWMFSGKRGWAGWSSLLVGMVPGIDGIAPEWTFFSTYAVIKNREDTSTV